MTKFHLTLILFLLTLTACASTPGEEESQQQTGKFVSNCGTVLNGSVRNPVDINNGIGVVVTQIVNHNLVIVSRQSGDQIVRLRGLSDNISALKAQRARNVLQSLRGNAVLFTDECQLNVAGGGQGIVGELFTLGGNSFAEILIAQSAAEVETANICDATLINGCYAALIESVIPPTGASVSNFLWKPVAERDGNLVVLLNPFNATVFLNGQQLPNFGPSNGRGTTARANRPGCAFGANIQITAIDSQGRALVFPGGATSFNIPNGCNRVEF